MTPWAAKCNACWDEPHCRSMVVAGTDSGQPAPSTALRPTLKACSPTWDTQPVMTSSTSAGSRSLRSARARSASDARSTACQFLSFPLRLPPAVRRASTMTASGIVLLPNGRTHFANPRGVPYRGEHEKHQRPGRPKPTRRDFWCAEQLNKTSGLVSEAHLVGLVRIELTTSSLSVTRSNRLSYSPKGYHST